MAPTYMNEMKTCIYCSNNYMKVTSISFPVTVTTKTYIVQETNRVAIVEINYEDLLSSNPKLNLASTATTTSFPNMPWANDGAKFTIFQPRKIKQPNQGYLCCSNQDWHFKVGSKSSKHNMSLTNLHK